MANGGGGHCGINGNAQDGQRGDVPALGTDCSNSDLRGSGGSGAAGEDGAAAGGSVFDPAGLGGGGGGGVGRIRINLPAGETFAPEGLISPANTAGVLGVR